MTLFSYLNLLRSKFRPLLLGVVLGLLAGSVVVFLTPDTYTSSTTAYISTNADVSNAFSAYQGSLLSQERVKSYVQLINGPRVAADVSRRLGVSFSTDQFASLVTASSQSDTVLINISATSETAPGAQVLAQATSSAFVDLVQQLEQSNTSLGRPAVTAQIVNPPSLPTAPSAPSVPIYLFISTLVAVSLSMIASLLSDLMRNTTTSTPELSALVEAPSLGAIPVDPSVESNPVVDLNDQRDVRAEAFRRLRANLRFVSATTNEPILITSAMPGEGKSYTAANLGRALALGGNRTVLIDADLRRPTVHETFGLDNNVGLTNVLIGMAGTEDSIQRLTSGGGLDIMTSGPLPPNPSELLSSEAMGKVLRGLRNRYDIILVDTPPVLPISDVLGLSVHAGAALLLACSGKTSKTHIQQAAHSLRQVPIRIAGCVLTMQKNGSEEVNEYVAAYDRSASTPAMSDEAARASFSVGVANLTDYTRRTPSPVPRSNVKTPSSN